MKAFLRPLAVYSELVLGCSTYSFQTFAALEVLGATKMNQIEINVRDHVHGDDGVSGLFRSPYHRLVGLTDATTISWDLSSATWATVTLSAGAGGTRAIANPSNIRSGMSGRLNMRQTTSGGNSATWGSAWEFPLNTAPILSTTSGDRDEFGFDSFDGATLQTAHLKGFSY